MTVSQSCGCCKQAFFLTLLSLFSYLAPSNFQDEDDRVKWADVIDSSSPTMSNNSNDLMSYWTVVDSPQNKNGRTFVEIEHPVFDSVRSGSVLKSDPYHAFDKIIDNFVRDATKFEIKGGDGIFGELYQIEGSLNGKSGIFEWIVDPRPEKGFTHRLFIKGGSITGKPNMIPRR